MSGSTRSGSSVRIGGTGHRGLPSVTAQLVREALRTRLASYADQELTGISALADGADQLFAKAILDQGGALHVIVPSAGYREALPAEAWPEYDRLLTRARQVECLTFPASTEEAHMEAGRLLVDRSDLLIAVWDGQPARGHGGTADVVAYAGQRGVPVEIVWPDGASRD